MRKIQLLQITPEELASLIKKDIKSEIELLKKELHSRVSPEINEFLSRDETAMFFKISKVTLHDWVNKGILTPYKMGNRTYFKYSELVDKLLSSNTTKNSK